MAPAGREALEMVDHGASASAAGYLYQTNWALVDLLRKGLTRPDQAMTLEMHDDVSWTSGDATEPVELLQVKLHAAAGGAGLGDMGVDLWKTLKVWIDRPDAGDPQGPDLSLVTTSVASPGSAAYALKPESAGVREVAHATQALLAAAVDSTNQATAAAREAFLALGEAGRTALLGRVQVLDGQLPPEDLNAAVREALSYALPSGGRLIEDRFVAQVWHWWAAVAVDLLARRRAAISVFEVRTFIRELRNDYTTDTLPTTVPLSAITDEVLVVYEGARFVSQLKLVNYGGPALRSAIIDYHRAVTQETEWLSDSLLELAELRNFEDELRFEWEREFHTMVQDLDLDLLSPEDAEAVKVRAGRKLLNYLLRSTAVTVRNRYNEGFYARGKRHELAGHDEVSRRIGWHPDFVARLEAIATSG